MEGNVFVAEVGDVADVAASQREDEDGEDGDDDDVVFARPRIHTNNWFVLCDIKVIISPTPEISFSFNLGFFINIKAEIAAKDKITPKAIITAPASYIALAPVALLLSGLTGGIGIGVTDCDGDVDIDDAGDDENTTDNEEVASALFDWAINNEVIE